MFKNYYDFIQRRLSVLGNLGNDTTFSNYLKAVLGGLIVIFSTIFMILVIAGIFTVPYLLYFFLITKAVSTHMSKTEENREMVSVIENKNNISKKDIIILEELKQTIKQHKKKTILKASSSFIVTLILYIAITLPLIFIISDYILGFSNILQILWLLIIGFYLTITILILVDNIIQIKDL